MTTNGTKMVMIQKNNRTINATWTPHGKNNTNMREKENKGPPMATRTIVGGHGQTSATRLERNAKVGRQTSDQAKYYKAGRKC